MELNLQTIKNTDFQPEGFLFVPENTTVSYADLVGLNFLKILLGFSENISIIDIQDGLVVE